MHVFWDKSFLIGTENRTVEKKRDSNIELFRIIVMFLIVAHHFIVNSSLPSVLSTFPTTFKTNLFCVLGMWGKTGINCFILITGYFMCTSQITLKKFLKLFFQIEFYSITISLCFFLANYEQYSVKMLLLDLFPIKSVSSGFVDCFLIFWLLIPFLNKFIRSLNQRQHLYLIVILFFSYVLMRFFPGAEITLNYVSWFVFLYFIASYIRLYLDETLKKLGEAKIALAAAVSILVSIVSVIALLQIAAKGIIPFSMSRIYYFVSDVNAPMALTTSILVFVFFKNLRLGYNPFINFVARTTFGILLLHAHCDAMRHLIWFDIFNAEQIFFKDWSILRSLLAILTVFFAGVFVDTIRLYCFEKPLFYAISKYKRTTI